ncbi:MAG: anthranilate synthase component I [Gammaproteobacteria bacterium]|nr:anthranilate synthase component I [Gammaproteobacteria bacterium]
MQSIKQSRYKTRGGIHVHRSSTVEDYWVAISRLTESLDDHRGVLLCSSYEFPGRYTRWDIGFVNPPLQVSSKGSQVFIDALNLRGEILLPAVYHGSQQNQDLAYLAHDGRQIRIGIKTEFEEVAEEFRSRQPSVFSVLRSLVDLFGSERDPYLGLYGAFGYDLGFQFEDVERFQTRDKVSRDLVLYLPDQILVADHSSGETLCHNYDFVCRNWDSPESKETTGGFRRTGLTSPFAPAIHVDRQGDHLPGEYAGSVNNALQHFRKGKLFEVVPGQIFFEPCKDKPSEVFRRLKESNPAPYGALINLGEQEYLVAASPEMFVRVDGRRIETCPISGTIKRGSDAIGDASQIRKLLNSAKDESELSMCTDVDRNDKARVCEPGSIKVIGRRQIELYSRLIHTVDHVTGTLDQRFDALDGFLAHTWAVTVTGAPKHAAMQFIEEHEKSPRLWYGGAIGHVGFDGNMNTGLTLRTMRIKDGVAEIRAGATLLIDSDPDAEEAETRLKASALLDAVRGKVITVKNGDDRVADIVRSTSGKGAGLKVLMVDHQDSFAHNLAAYFRQCGVSLITMRPELAKRYLLKNRVDLVILSPGPGIPADFNTAGTIELCLQNKIPMFGVCLGLQALVEYFGGSLGILEYPMHGKSSMVRHLGGVLFNGIPEQFNAGRYHSLVAERIPDCLEITAHADNDTVMAIEHRSLPVMAVQFHPESILTLQGNTGLRLIANVVQYMAALKARDRTACQGTSE